VSWPLLDTALMWIGIVAQAGLAALLIRTRVYKRLPLFCIYVLWGMISDSLGILVSTRFAGIYPRYFVYQMALDCILQFSVLVELAWSVLKPLQSSLPRWTVPAIAGLILIAGLAVWPISGSTVMHGLPPEWHLFLRLRQTSSMLQILFFVLLAAGSHLFSISWRDREMQVATGLGFYSLVNLAVSLIHAQLPQQIAYTYYHKVDEILPVCYFCALMYWAVNFAQKEAIRQEFTPQMRNFLLTVSGAAHAGRIALDSNTLRGNRRG
jgi:hypothetical protein